MLAGILVDICVVALLVIMVIVGIKKGFFGSAFGLITTLITLGGGAGLSFLLCTYAFPNMGGIWTGLKDSFGGMIGGNSTLLETMGMPADDLAETLTFVVFFIIGFIICSILVGILMVLLVKLLKACRKFTGFKIVDSTLGVIINVALVGGIILVILGFINSFEGTGLMVGLREFLKSTHVTKFLYQSRLNFFSGIFDSMGIADLFVEVFG